MAPQYDCTIYFFDGTGGMTTTALMKKNMFIVLLQR